ncbi:cation/H(+) antiporter [Rhodococcus rhodnii]|uniref:Cation/H+ exchanger transmembrane domain-containing protein n=2 Tax=Rhodococcus rhodnii TaxID=38312 RepID=R7WNM1_9NOCA|nr:cation:proton antiporter [Rhodococcus rhodnii]EOM76911.1 hypothetical protein Rrhod_1824 [Rhodococcus rhodnii LMG 5362]TXG89733.1 cation/H(+) antiporter [Rhodococcus rhodnii]
MTFAPPLDPHVLLPFITQVAVLVAAALALGRLAARIGLPPVTGELLAGIVVGPSLLGTVAPGMHARLFPADPVQWHLLDAAAHLGLLLLVGLAAASLDVGFLRARRGAVASVSLGAFAIPLAAGIALGYLLPSSLAGDDADDLSFALFFGIVLAVSAVPVIAKTLADLGLLHRDVGQLTLVSGTIDDALGWILLAVTAAMVTSGVEVGVVAGSLGAVLAVVVVALLARRPVATVASRSPSLVLPCAVVLILAGGAVTQAMHLEAVLGAFAAGFALRRISPALLAPLRTVTAAVFAPLFLATAGLRVDLGVFAQPDVLVAGLAVLAVAVAAKFAGAYAGARAARIGHWDSLALGAGLNARGAVEIVIAMIGVGLGILTAESYAIVVLVAISTSIMAGPLLMWTMRRSPVTDAETQRARSAEA